MGTTCYQIQQEDTTSQGGESKTTIQQQHQRFGLLVGRGEKVCIKNFNSIVPCKADS